ncbi:MAG TPA: hypothetical protein VLE22_12550 [Bryobacteraceae bacterium]|nr:hypothetical protein [Bryobacteraceae bacterium]
MTKLVEKLEEAKRRFGPGEAQRTEALLNEAAKARVIEADELIRFHEALLFHRAYPKSEGVLQRAEDLLASFGERAARADPEPFEEPEVSGIAGTAFSAIFSYDVARRLVELHPNELEVDWERFELTDRAAGLWRRLFPLVEEDTLVEAHVPYRAWLDAAAGSDRQLGWLLRRIAALPATEPEKADLYRSLDLAVRWNLGNSEATRTRTRLPASEVFYHDEPLLRRSGVSLAAELDGPPLTLERLSPAHGRAVLDTALRTSAVRYRELHGFTYGDAKRVWKANIGRGVAVYVCGVPRERRLPLRAYHAATMFKNGVPVGYFETLTLFGRLEVGFNLYYTFREGETAWLFGQLLRLFRQMLGVTCFSVDPYQIGDENDEAIESGAFWFYRKLGFRSTEAPIENLAKAEERKIAAAPGYRTPARTLRRLATAPVIYEMPGGETGAWDRFRVRNIGLALQRSRRREEAPGGLAAILPLIPDFGRWSAEEKRRASDVVRAKSAPDETTYVRTMQRHAKLRDAVLRLGTTAPPK